MQGLTGEVRGAGVRDQHEQGEADRGAYAGRGGRDRSGHALLAVGHAGGGRDEHRGEHDAVTGVYGAVIVIVVVLRPQPAPLTK